MYSELYHYGVKGMRWGVRHDTERSSKVKKKNRRNSKIINREIRYQKKKIALYERRASEYESSAKDVRKTGISYLKANGHSTDNAKRAVELSATRRETEAQWNRHIAKHLKDYNKRLSEIDVSEMSKRETWAVIRDLGNTKTKEINSTWKEPKSTELYYKAITRGR